MIMPAPAHSAGVFQYIYTQVERTASDHAANQTLKCTWWSTGG